MHAWMQQPAAHSQPVSSLWAPFPDKHGIVLKQMQDVHIS